MSTSLTPTGQTSAPKYIFVTGGVVSSLGKGIAAASLGRLLVERGFRVTMMKLDPYLNVDPGTMSPFQHGEVFVTDDGAETDLDLGHYERFTGTRMGKGNNLTTGQVYFSVISKERRGWRRSAARCSVPSRRGVIRVAHSNRSSGGRIQFGLNGQTGGGISTGGGAMGG